ncbi:MAG: hypothetical protein AAF995_11600 [Planctomycetota bacterium]
MDADAETGGLAPRNARPANMVDHVVSREWVVDEAREDVWAWLSDPRTFTKQIWPYRVEFIDGSGEGGASGFAPGVLNAHHGPLLMAAGVLTVVDDGDDGKGAHRELLYGYGSRVIAFRWIRPVSLRFWVEDAGEGRTRVRLELASWCRPWIGGAYRAVQGFFWLSFPTWMRPGARGKRRERLRSDES